MFFRFLYFHFLLGYSHGVLACLCARACLFSEWIWWHIVFHKLGPACWGDIQAWRGVTTKMECRRLSYMRSQTCLCRSCICWTDHNPCTCKHTTAARIPQDFPGRGPPLPRTRHRIQRLLCQHGGGLKSLQQRVETQQPKAAHLVQKQTFIRSEAEAAQKSVAASSSSHATPSSSLRVNRLYQKKKARVVSKSNRACS